MNDTSMPQKIISTDQHAKDLEEENELLLLQLHQVQEELEHYFLRNRELEQGAAGQSIASGVELRWVDDSLPDTLAELERLKTVCTVQVKVHKLEMENSLSARLGNILIDSADNNGVLSVPIKLMKVWRQASKKTPPALLGGKSFWKVVSAYDAGGFEAVEKLLAQSSVLPSMKGNAYTALARHLQKSDVQKAADAAYRAYAEDPQPYRLKWLACRLHEAGKVQDADAMLTVLPEGMNFSESEERQASQIRYEAKAARLRKAHEVTQFQEARAEIERRLNDAAMQCSKQQKLARDRQTRVDELTKEKNRLEQEKRVLQARLAKLADDDSKKQLFLDQLREQHNALLMDKTELQQQYEEKAQTVESLQANIDQLAQTREGLKYENFTLQKKLDRQTERDAERQVRIEKQLVQYEALRGEKNELLHQREEQLALEAERKSEFDDLLKSKEILVGEISALQVRCDEYERITQEAREKISELERLKDNKFEENMLLQKQLKDRLRCGEEQQKQIDKLLKEKEKLVKDMTVLHAQYEKQIKLNIEQRSQLSHLTQQIQLTDANRSEAAKRQQLMQEELIRAESQLDLIKDLLREETSI